MSWLINHQSCDHVETSQLIANQLTGFYMTATLAFNELSKSYLAKYLIEYLGFFEFPVQNTVK